MKRILFVLIIAAALIVPVLAGTDTFHINTVYTSPTNYVIDYGADTTGEVNVYTVESTTALVGNNTWLLLGSNDKETITELDEQVSITFVANTAQTFTVATPAHYRFYYLVLETGFYNTATALNVTLYSAENSTATTEGTTMVFDGGDAGIGIGIVGCVGVLGLLGLAVKKKD